MSRLDKLGRVIGYNWWREFNVDALRCADQSWWLLREQTAIGYQTEEQEFQQQNPRPTFKRFLETNKGLGGDPDG